MCCIINSTEEDAAVLGGVGKPGKVNASSFAVFVGYQAAVFAVHVQNLVVAALGVNTAFSFAEVDFAGGILQDKVFAVHLVIFIGAHGKAKFPVNPKYIA